MMTARIIGIITLMKCQETALLPLSGSERSGVRREGYFVGRNVTFIHPASRLSKCS